MQLKHKNTSCTKSEVIIHDKSKQCLLPSTTETSKELLASAFRDAEAVKHQDICKSA